MSEAPDRESKTEEATEKKRRDAIEKGNVPFSREAATLASLAALLVVTAFLFVGNAQHLRLALQVFIDDPGGWRLENGADVIRLFQAVGIDAARLLVPVVIVLGLAGILSSVLQNPPALVLDRIMPDLSRLSLSKGWRRLFGMQGQVEFLKALFKLGVVVLVGYIVLRSTEGDVLKAMFLEPTVVPELVRNLMLRLVSAMVLATVVLVVADLVWSRVFWQRELRMTRQEVKDEQKQMDGDPILKARMRSLARDRSRRRMMTNVPRATLVIANPTHYAVALRYVREETGAPIVVAKGQDLIALRIRQIAEENGIPVIEDKPLARSLYDSVQVDRMIPPEFYKAVAEIVLFLMVRKGGARPPAN
ncbi:MAG: flagellar biosynthesis protein FlhB [Hyphomicrobiaceae bacterium]